MDALLEQLAAAKAGPGEDKRWRIPGRIAYVVGHSLPFSNSGHALRTHGVAAALAARGVQVYAFTRPGLPWELPEFADPGFQHRHTIDGVHYIHQPAPPAGLADAYGEWFRVFKPSAVVAASDFATALPALIAARRAALPFVYEVRSFWDLSRRGREPQWQNSPAFRSHVRAESAVAKAASGFVTLNQEMLEELARRGVAKDKIAIVPDGVPALPDLQPRNPATAAKLGLEGSLVVGYVGPLDAQEGLDDLVAACGQLRRQGLAVKLLVVGSSGPCGAAGAGHGDFARELRTAGEQSGFAEHIALAGPAAPGEIGAYYALADVIVLPRKPDPAGELVPPAQLVEALAYGKPVLASSVAPLQEVAAAGCAIEYFAKGSLASLQGKLSALLQDLPAANRRAGEARKWVGQNRLWAGNVGSLAKIVEGLAGKAAPRPRPAPAPLAGPPQAALEKRFFLDVHSASKNLKLTAHVAERVIESGGNLGKLGEEFGKLGGQGKPPGEAIVNGVVKGLGLLRFLDKKQVILVAGHDLRFVDPFIKYFSKYFTVIIDEWASTNQHDPKKSSELLHKADIIWCEWCCENAVWYSKHRKPGQKLFVRLHKFEIERKFPSNVDWAKVEALIFIAEGMRVYANALHNIKCRQLLLYNAFDVDAVDRQKTGPRDLKALAVVGYVPKIKRLDLAIDAFAALYQSDPRFSLHIKGKSAREMDWVWAKESEYFAGQDARIEALAAQGATVAAQPYDDKVHAWLGGKGFLLSASDIEGSHQAVAEAMAAGTVPVVFGDWVGRYGARLLYPSEVCFSALGDAVEFIRTLSDDPAEFHKLSERVKYFAHQNFNQELVLQGALSIFAGNFDPIEYVGIPQPKRILVFSDLCLNVIDGSSVWLLSTVEMLLLDANIEVVLVSREPIQNAGLLEPFFKTGRFHLEVFTAGFNEQSHAEYLKFLAAAAAKHQAHKIIVRAAPALANKAMGALPDAVVSRIIYYVIGEAYPDPRFLSGVHAFFVQTEEALRRLRAKFGDLVARKKVAILRPMVPEAYAADIVPPKGRLSVVYMGKLSKEYMAAEMVDFIRKAPEHISFLVLAAKYHRTDGEDYVKKLRSALNAAQGAGKALVLHSLDRLDVMRLAKGGHVGWSLRSQVYAESSEISTKVLEYCSLGKPVILNDFASNKALLGDAYPLYANSIQEAAQRMELLLSDAALYRQTAEHCVAVAQRYKMSRILNDVIDIIVH